jgi:lipoprotein-releasing system permease protein
MEFWIARKYMFSNKGFISVLSLFSFLGIMLGVATLIVVMSVMNGFKEELLNRLVGMKGHIIVQSKTSNGIEDYENLRSFIQQDEKVFLASPIIEKQGLVITKGFTQGILIRAMNLKDIKKREVFSLNSLDSFEGNKILIGIKMAERFGLKIGDTINIMIPDTTQTSFGVIPKQKKFIVHDIFEVGVNDFDKNVVLIPIETGQLLFNLKEKVNCIEVFLKNPNDLGSFYHKLLDKFLVLDWKHSDKNIFHAVTVERNVMFLILTLIIVVASFNIVSGLIILVKDKIRDISILKTIGMSKFSVLKIFLIMGSMIGVGGTIVGLIIGLLTAFNLEKIRQFLQIFLGTELFDAEIYFLSQLPSKVDFSDILIVAFVGIGLSIISTIYPSIKAASLNPASGIKG